MKKKDWKQHDNLIRHERREIILLCQNFNLPEPWGPYRARMIDCYECDKRTIVYTWLQHEVRGQNSPPFPKPRCIRKKSTWDTESDEVKFYWANHCIHCGVVQGDNYLYGESFFASKTAVFRYSPFPKWS